MRSLSKLGLAIVLLVLTQPSNSWANACSIFGHRPLAQNAASPRPEPTRRAETRSDDATGRTEKSRNQSNENTESTPAPVSSTPNRLRRSFVEYLKDAASVVTTVISDWLSETSTLKPYRLQKFISLGEKGQLHEVESVIRRLRNAESEIEARRSRTESAESDIQTIDRVVRDVENEQKNIRNAVANFRMAENPSDRLSAAKDARDAMDRLVRLLEEGPANLFFDAPNSPLELARKIIELKEDIIQAENVVEAIDLKRARDRRSDLVPTVEQTRRALKDADQRIAELLEFLNEESASPGARNRIVAELLRLSESELSSQLEGTLLFEMQLAQVISRGDLTPQNLQAIHQLLARLDGIDATRQTRACETLAVLAVHESRAEETLRQWAEQSGQVGENANYFLSLLPGMRSAGRVVDILGRRDNRSDALSTLLRETTFDRLGDSETRLSALNHLEGLIYGLIRVGQLESFCDLAAETSVTFSGSRNNLLSEVSAIVENRGEQRTQVAPEISRAWRVAHAGAESRTGERYGANRFFEILSGTSLEHAIRYFDRATGGTQSAVIRRLLFEAENNSPEISRERVSLAIQLAERHTSIPNFRQLIIFARRNSQRASMDSARVLVLNGLSRILARETFSESLRNEILDAIEVILLSQRNQDDSVYFAAIRCASIVVAQPGAESNGNTARRARQLLNNVAAQNDGFFVRTVGRLDDIVPIEKEEPVEGAFPFEILADVTPRSPDARRIPIQLPPAPRRSQGTRLANRFGHVMEMPRTEQRDRELQDILDRLITRFIRPLVRNSTENRQTIMASLDGFILQLRHNGMLTSFVEIYGNREIQMQGETNSLANHLEVLILKSRDRTVRQAWETARTRTAEPGRIQHEAGAAIGRIPGTRMANAFARANTHSQNQGEQITRIMDRLVYEILSPILLGRNSHDSAVRQLEGLILQLHRLGELPAFIATLRTRSATIGETGAFLLDHCNRVIEGKEIGRIQVSEEVQRIWTQTESADARVVHEATRSRRTRSFDEQYEEAIDNRNNADRKTDEQVASEIELQPFELEAINRAGEEAAKRAEQTLRSDGSNTFDQVRAAKQNAKEKAENAQRDAIMAERVKEVREAEQKRSDQSLAALSKRFHRSGYIDKIAILEDLINRAIRNEGVEPSQHVEFVISLLESPRVKLDVLQMGRTLLLRVLNLDSSHVDNSRAIIAEFFPRLISRLIELYPEYRKEPHSFNESLLTLKRSLYNKHESKRVEQSVRRALFALMNAEVFGESISLRAENILMDWVFTTQEGKQLRDLVLRYRGVRFARDISRMDSEEDFIGFGERLREQLRPIEEIQEDPVSLYRNALENPGESGSREREFLYSVRALEGFIMAFNNPNESGQLIANPALIDALRRSKFRTDPASDGRTGTNYREILDYLDNIIRTRNDVIAEEVSEVWNRLNGR